MDKLATTTKDRIILQSTIQNIVFVHPKDQFLLCGGTEEDFLREAGFAMQLMTNNPYLAKMDKLSIVQAIVTVAQTKLTLNPELKLCYLIPRKGKLYCQSSYMGKREILLRAGIVKDVWAKLVYKNDIFEVKEGSNRNIKHEPDYFSDRGELVGGYWCAALMNGERPFGVMTKKEIDGIKQRSEAVKSGKTSAWDTDYDEMSLKTIINRAFKSLPKTGISDSVLKALKADSVLDNQITEDIDEQVKAANKDFFDGDRQDGDSTEDAEIVDDKSITTGKVEDVLTELLKEEIKTSKLSEAAKNKLLDTIPTMNDEEIVAMTEKMEQERLQSE